MSKTALKKELQKLSKEQLIEQVLDLYSNNKAVKSFYDYYLNPTNEKELLEKCKKIIGKEFGIENPMRAGLKFSVAKQAISELKGLKVSPEVIADAMLYLAECACQFTAENGDMDEPYYIAAWNNYKAALKFIAKNDLLPQFKIRSKQCEIWASHCDYGFDDDISDVYFEYYNN
ncbi:MAG: DUF6155 family protein [Chitinophagales bacterium]|nr:DUF6155 family protein [Chitinophagales bacterium]